MEHLKLENWFNSTRIITIFKKKTMIFVSIVTPKKHNVYLLITHIMEPRISTSVASKTTKCPVCSH